MRVPDGGNLAGEHFGCDLFRWFVIDGFVLRGERFYFDVVYIVDGRFKQF